jgi:hypothetical protein
VSALRRGRSVIYVVSPCCWGRYLCASLTTSLVLTLLLAVKLADGEGKQGEIRIPSWINSGRREYDGKDACRDGLCGGPGLSIERIKDGRPIDGNEATRGGGRGDPS